MKWRKVNSLCIAFLPIFLAFLNAEAKVRNLLGSPNFHSILLKWDLTPASQKRAGNSNFEIKFCELQAWGPHFCHTKVSDNETLIKTEADGVVGGHEAYAFELKGKKNNDYSVCGIIQVLIVMMYFASST